RFAGVPRSAERGDDQLVRHVAAPEHVEPHIERLTLTPFLVVTARTVVLQVTGDKKAAVLARALKAPEDLVACPAQWLRRAAGRGGGGAAGRRPPDRRRAPRRKSDRAPAARAAPPQVPAAPFAAAAPVAPAGTASA